MITMIFIAYHYSIGKMIENSTISLAIAGDAVLELLMIATIIVKLYTV